MTTQTTTTNAARDAEHTPGPWHVAYATDGELPTGALLVATATDEANARLIAAAPELLAALRELQAQLRAHIKLDVKKHYSLMVADAAASKAVLRAEGGGES